MDGWIFCSGRAFCQFDFFEGMVEFKMEVVTFIICYFLLFLCKHLYGVKTMEINLL